MITYNTIKKDPAKYKQSQELLSTIWNDSRYLTNELKEFPEIGLGLFAIAGGLHLVIVQERAVTDRDHANPNNSPWADDLIRKAQEFAPFALANHNRIISTRAAAISEVRFIERSVFVPETPVPSTSRTGSGRIPSPAININIPKGQGCLRSRPPNRQPEATGRALTGQRSGAIGSSALGRSCRRRTIGGNWGESDPELTRSSDGSP